ncbi:O-antigen ligase family protein [Succinimonas amylolytica]|uniref:O-antigen ligase family protein n=1 Tax=Succinimonas amylolytica TaxID=83769 RepID=UPI000370F388|nr:hypothetical protein [Succinimonas amylolytica]
MVQTVKAVLGLILCIYFFFAMHIKFPAEAIGLGNPANLLTLALGSLIIGCGMICPFARHTKEVYFSKLLLPLALGTLAFLIASLIHLWQKGLVNFEPAIWGALTTLLVFAMGQLRLSWEAIRDVLSMIAISGIIEAATGISQGRHDQEVSGSFTSPWILGIFLDTAVAASLWLLITSKKLNMLRLLTTIATIVTVLAALMYISDMTLFNIAIAVFMIALFSFSKTGNKLSSKDRALIYGTIALSFIGIIAAIFLSRFESSGTAVHTDEALLIMESAPVSGHGFGTFSRIRAEWLFNHLPDLGYTPKSEGNLLRYLAIEGGFPALVGIITFLYAIVRTILGEDRRLYDSLGITILFLPIIISCVINSSLEAAYILPLCLAIFAVIADSVNSGIIYKFRSVEAMTGIGALIPVLVLAFVITGMISLPPMNRMISSETFHLSEKNRIINPLPRMGEFTRGRDTEALANALNTGIPGLILEARMNLNNSLPYTVNCSTLKVAQEADVFLAKEKELLSKGAPGFNIPEQERTKAFVTYICGDSDIYLHPDQKFRAMYFRYRTRLMNSEKEHHIEGVSPLITSTVPYIMFKTFEFYAEKDK